METIENEGDPAGKSHRLGNKPSHQYPSQNLCFSGVRSPYFGGNTVHLRPQAKTQTPRRCQNRWVFAASPEDRRAKVNSIDFGGEEHASHIGNYERIIV